MGTEIFGAYVKDKKLDIPSVPPGFKSLTSFTLRRVEENTMITCSASSTASESQSAQTTMEIDGECAKIIRSLRQRPWINHGHCNNNSEDEYEVDQVQQNLPARHGLPKGVIRGCPDCSNCQKVVARWRPEDACKPGVLDAPVFYPNEEEFEDTLEYISSIRLKAEQCGICRIVPPPSWKPPCSLKEKSVWECSKFGTRVQRIDKLQNRSSMRKLSKIQNNKRKRKKCMKIRVDCGVGSSNPSNHGDTGLSEADSFGFEPGPDFTLDTFNKYADDFKARYFSSSQTDRDMETNMFTPNEQWEPSPEIIEGEYWRMVEEPTEEIEVLYGADLETGTFSSGFPKMSNRFGSASDEKYIKSGWNLNNFPRLPGSVLSYESSDISGVLVPWLYIGMCFSSFCWHVEDHHLYSLNYLHWGAPKIWYGVPACDALKLETAMRKHLPDLFEEQPDLLHKLVTQLSPSILKSEGVPVYRCVQNPGEFVLTFPRAYHSGFNCGFNCAEAVNVAPIDWLPHGQIAVELYCKQGRRTSISHDKLLLGAAKEAVKAHWELKLVKKNTVDNLRWKSVCGKDGILSKALKTRVEMERMRRDFLCSSTQATKMDISFDATTERECAICLFDLHLSAAGCHCSPDRYVCLNHAKQLCGCAWSARFFLFRYDINELNILVEALEGKLSAVYRWARMDLGLALSSSVSKSNMQPQEESILPILNLSSPCCQVSKKETSYSGSPVAEKPEVNVILLSDDEGQEPKKPISTLSTKHSENMQPQESTGKLSSFSEGKAVQDVNLQGSVKPLEIVFALKHMKASPSYNRPLLETKKAKHGSLIKKEESILPISSLSSPCCQVSKKETSYSGSPVAEKPEVNVILLSDDEGQEPKKPISTLSTKHSENMQPQESTGKLSSFSEGKAVQDVNLQVSVKPLEFVFALKHMKASPSYDRPLLETKKANHGSLIKKEESILPISSLSSPCCQISKKETSYSGSPVAEKPEVNVILVSDDEGQEPKKLISTLSTKHSEIYGNMAIYDDRRNPVLTPMSDAKTKWEGDTTSLHSEVQNGSSPIKEEEDQHKGGMVLGSDISCQLDSTNVNSNKIVNHFLASIGSILQPLMTRKPHDEDEHEKIETNDKLHIIHHVNNLDRGFCQKGPRIAKAVRRINCNVELVELGVVLSGKSWCNNQTIFPKGFKSRVCYNSVLDPINMSYYVSEILDAGDRPLFMVSLEHCSSEVFIHVTPARCWEMVRERVNQEIAKQHKLGRKNLPSLQPPGSVDGFEMFGFSSAAIVQAVEALDQSQVCKEYWNSRPYSHPHVQISRTRDSGGRLNDQGDSGNHAVYKTLGGLFKKANLEELSTLYSILNDTAETVNGHLVIQLLMEEIYKRSR